MAEAALTVKRGADRCDYAPLNVLASERASAACIVCAIQAFCHHLFHFCYDITQEHTMKKPMISDLLNKLSTDAYETTIPEAHKENTCVNCKEDALNKCYSQAGIREYKNSGLCEPCFDEIMKDAYFLHD
jgi:hypothetical protein